MAPLLVTFAVNEEASPFQQLAGSRSDLRVLLTGIGQRNAEKAFGKALAEQSPKLVLTCGFAGGLNPELATGTVVFSVDEPLTSPMNPPPTLPREGSQFPACAGLGSGPEVQDFATQPDRLATVLVAAGSRPAKFHCAGQVAVSAEEKRALW